jgi:hypothetical protein
MYYKVEVNKRRLEQPERKFAVEKKGGENVHVNGMQTVKLYLGNR